MEIEFQALSFATDLGFTTFHYAFFSVDAQQLISKQQLSAFYDYFLS